MKKISTAAKIPIMDIPSAAFQHLHGNTPQIVMSGTRAVCMFNADDIFYRLAERYNNNEPVNVLDFVNAQRQIRAMVFAVRGQG